MSSRLLRAHVSDGPQGRAHAGQHRGLVGLRQPEVQYFRHAVCRQHHVGALDIAVHDFFCVRSFQRLRYLGSNIYRFREFKWTFLYDFRQRLSIDVFHHDERAYIVGIGAFGNRLVYFKDAGNMRVVKLRGSFRLTVETCTVFLGAKCSRGQHFDSHRSIEFRVLGLVHDPHSATAEFLLDAIMS